MAEVFAQTGVRVLMVAENRASKDPGIGERVERFLMVVFRSLTTMARPRG
jgi:hypothetical protein